MASDDIQQRLMRWAEWLLRSSGGGMGFPRECSYTRMQGRSQAGFCSAEVDIESSETEKAIQTLTPQYRLAVQVYYLHGGTRQQQARHLQIHVRTMERRVAMAHTLIGDALDDFKRKRVRKNLNLSA